MSDFESNKKHYTSRILRKRKNGWTYVMERISVYDPKIQNAAVLSEKLIGKLPPNYTDISQMQPTRKRAPKKQVPKDLPDTFENIEDERQASKVLFPFPITVFIMLLATLAGNSTCRQIATYWEVHFDFLKSFFANFPDAVISHDTIHRIFKLIGKQNSDEFLKNLTDIAVKETIQPRVIAVDGQAVKAARIDEHIPYTLNVYDVDNTLVLNQVLIGAKENEITNAVKSIEKLNIEDCIVTADALNTQKNFVKTILSKNADYCLAIKQNQHEIYEEMSLYFSKEAEKITQPKILESVDGEHGRVETRKIIILPGNILPDEILAKWAGLEDGCLIQASTESYDKKTQKTSKENRYFISSLRFQSPQITKVIQHAIRGHWGIENNLHWVLDVMFDQDRTQCRNAEFLKGKMLMNKLALNYLYRLQSAEKEQTGKESNKSIWRTKLNAIQFATSAIFDLFRKKSA